MNVLLRIFTAAALAGVAFLPARGEEAGGRFLVRSWQSEDGLPSNAVRSVAQAADGYLWVATAEGVVRFDGVRFTGFDAEPDVRLARGATRTLFATANGDVWVTTTRGGLLRWRGGRLTRVWKEQSVTSPPRVTQVADDGRGGVLLVRGTEVWRAAGDAAPVPLEQTPDVAERLRLDAEASPVRGGFGVAAQLRDRRGRVWRAAPVRGLTVTDSSGTASVELATVEPGNRIAELFEDREGNIWAATGDSGLVQIRERRADVLTVADGLSDRTVFAVMQDRAGAWWVGSKRGGLDRIVGGAVTHYEIGDGTYYRPISALCEDRAGTLWTATRDGSVFRLAAGGFVPAFDPVSLPSKVMAIAEDADGRMWFGGSQGLAVLASGKVARVGETEGFAVASVSALAADAAGAVWVGTHDGDVFRGGEKGFFRLGGASAPVGRAVLALLPDADGSVWAATLGGGLYHWRDGRFTGFAAREGLPDPRLTCVVDDGAGFLWLGSLAGIFRVSKAELHEIEERRRTTARWLQLDRSDGLLTRECTGGFQPAGWRAQDGELRFPTVNGLVRIRPDAIVTNPVPPPVIIEELRANDQPLSLAGGAVKTGPGRTRLEFRYTGLSFSAPERVRFRSRIVGLEAQWRDLGTQRTIAYEVVPPGRYRFEVQAANNDGVWNETGASLAVTVLPHFWETAWFLALAAALAVAAAGGIGWGIARGRMKRRLALIELRSVRESERARIARDLHDDLGASLTEISMLAAITAEENAPLEPVREPLQQIAGKARALVGALDEIVWAVNPRHDTLASLADYLAAFASEFLASTGMALRLDVARDLPPLALAAERRHGLFLAVREALHNAVKHSGAREVWLRLRLDAGRLLLTIEDHGRGFDPAADSGGDGVRNLRERMAALGGECRIESIDGAGTQVHLLLAMPTP